MLIRPMTIDDYEEVYSLWMSCKGMGLNIKIKKLELNY